MAPNPFIELARDPVATLALTGYAIGLVALILLSTWWSLRKMGTLYVQYHKNKHTDKWWSGPLDVGVIPPPEWTIALAGVLLVWAITAWAIGALVWVIA